MNLGALAMQRREERGNATLQAAIVMAAVLFILLAIIQYIYWQRGTHVAIAAANEGNRYARFFDGGEQDATAVVGDFLDQAPGYVWNPDVRANRDLARPLPEATVEVHGSAFPILRWPDLPIHARSSGPIEHARPAAQMP